MIQFINNVCLCGVFLSLIFILVQRELMHIVFSLIVFVGFVAGFFSLRAFEFLVLILFIIYVGVIAVLFLFITIIYKLPKIKVQNSLHWIALVLGGTFLFWDVSMDMVDIVEVHAVDISYMINFINQQPELIVVCGVLLLISIVCSLIMVATISRTKV